MEAEAKVLITSLADRVLRLAVAEERETLSRENTNAHLQQIAGHLAADVTAKIPTQLQAMEQRIDARLDAFEREMRRMAGGGEKPDHGKLLASFAAMPRFTQVLIVLALLLVTASGWLAKVLG